MSRTQRADLTATLCGLNGFVGVVEFVPSMAEVHHETVFFTGRVQGVGFRYTAMQIAREFEVSGYVKNLADGRVQLEAEGRPDEVAAFIAAIDERMHGYLRKTERAVSRRSAEFTGFTIR